ncbi:hypothetical protein OAN11_00755 [Candidatus Pelagibacter sp.]|nr:hypothetical protein [Candidatus Pelagibacter sp.]
MFKIFNRFLLIYFFLSLSVFANQIKSIEVQGNKRISNESIILFSEITPGMIYSSNLVNESVKKLYNTNFFEKIEITYNESLIIIDVLENPIIEELEIIGVKKKNF